MAISAHTGLIGLLVAVGMLAGRAHALEPTGRCPVAPPEAGPPGGSPPRVVMAKTVRAGDVSTSRVISPDPAVQIRCGQRALRGVEGVVFAKLRLADGRDKTLAMDVLSPAAGGPRPLVVYVTGGGFIRAPRTSALDMRTYVAEAGYVVASVEYRTIGDGATYRDGVSDVKAAIRYLRAHATAFGIDPDHVAVWGDSAGGYLAAMVGVTGGEAAFDVGENLEQSSSVQAVVDKFGASDVSRIAADFEPETQAAFAAPSNPIFRYVAPTEASGVANPISYVDAKDPPFLLFHGDHDTLISPSQTLTLHTALRAAGVDSTRYVLVGAGHGDLAFVGDSQAGLAWSSREAMDDLVAFLKRVLH